MITLSDVYTIDINNIMTSIAEVYGRASDFGRRPTLAILMSQGTYIKALQRIEHTSIFYNHDAITSTEVDRLMGLAVIIDDSIEYGAVRFLYTPKKDTMI